MLKKKSKITIGLLVFILVLIGSNSILILAFGRKDNIVDNLIGFLSVAIQVLSAILIVVQLKESRKTQEAEFIMNLNMSFVQNDNYSRAYTELEKGAEAQLSRVEISNYLTFFESIYLLLKNSVINMKILDDLFAYRFFIAVHNPMIQDSKLVSSPYNFRNIYNLEKMWMDYRKENHLKIYKEDYCLQVSCIRAGKSEIYDDIINSKGEK